MTSPKRLFDVLVVGELNVDLILHEPDNLPQLEKEILARDLSLTLGSSSAIFAANLSSLGMKVAFCGKLGRDFFGDLVEDSLKKANVDTRFLIRDAGAKTGLTAILAYTEERAMVTYPGAMESLSFKDVPERALRSARHLHVSSFFLQKGIRKDFPRLFALAKASGLTTSLDPQWDPDESWNHQLMDCLPHVDVFLPNLQEAFSISSKGDIKSALRFFKQKVTLPVIKMGKAGAATYFEDAYYFTPAFPVEFVDAVGAGDSFDAGFIFGYLSGWSIPKSMELACACGALCTTAPGGTTAFANSRAVWEALKNIMKNHRAQKLIH